MNKLSETLGFSIDSFINSNYGIPSDLSLIAEPEVDSDIAAMRDSIPVLKKGKLETLLL